MGRLIRSQRYSHKGTSVIEVVAILSIILMLLASVIPVCVDRINRAKYEKMINEMTSIARASIDYYRSQYPNTWPDPNNWASQLAPNSVAATKFLFNAVTSCPWGNNYSLSFQNNLVQVSTTIPSGIAEKNPEGPLLNVVTGPSTDQISIALSVPNEVVGRVQYEKKYLYNQ